jgi:hypothetical protein
MLVIGLLFSLTAVPSLAATTTEEGWGVASWSWSEEDSSDQVDAKAIEQQTLSECNQMWDTNSMDEWTADQIEFYLDLYNQRVSDAFDKYNRTNKTIHIVVAFTMPKDKDYLENYVRKCNPYVYLTKDGKFYSTTPLVLSDKHLDYATAALTVKGYGDYEAMICHNGEDGVPTAQNASYTAFSKLTIKIYNGGFSARSNYIMSPEIAQKLMEEYEISSGAGYPVIYSFDDVLESDWFHDPVIAATSVGLIKGKSDTLFAPKDNITYAEAITLATRMYAMCNGEDFDSYPKKANPWYQPYLDYAKKHGIPWKYADYNAAIPRAEFVHIFYKAVPADYLAEVKSVEDGSIPDVSMRHKYASEIYALYRAGVLTGKNDAGSFYPKNPIERCEAAAIMARMMGL